MQLKGIEMLLRPYFFRAMWRTVLAVMLLALALGVPAALSETGPSEAWKQKLPKPPIAVTEMYVAAYSKDFARRFNLPNPGPDIELSQPIYAMRLFIDVLFFSHQLNAPAYGCTLQVYVDNRLPIAFPTEAKTWSRRIYAHDKQAWLDRKPGLKRLNDQVLIADSESLANRMVAIATPNYEWGKQGIFGTHFIEAFDREFVPGIAYLELRLLCPSPEAVSSATGLELWLKKKGTPDFRTARMDYDAFYKFPIPRTLPKRAALWLAWEQEYSRVFGQEHARRTRSATSGSGPSE